MDSGRSSPVKKSLFEKRDDAARHARELMERCNNRLLVNDLRIAEHYVKGDLIVALDCVSGEPQQDNFRLLTKANKLGRFNGVQPEAGGDLYRGAGLGDGKPGHHDLAVKVTVSDSIEGPEELIPSLSVGLQISDHLSGVGTQQLYFSLCTGAFKFILVPREWEVRPLGGISSGLQGQIVDEVVQARAEIGNGISNNSGYLSGHWARKRDLQDAGTGIAIRLYRLHDKIGVRSEKGAKAGLKIDDMMLGPFDL